ncbi:Inorganic diphosphatase [Bertholletia excelsa]
MSDNYTKGLRGYGVMGHPRLPLGPSRLGPITINFHALMRLECRHHLPSLLLASRWITATILRSKSSLQWQQKRVFTCTALYKPEVQIREEGQPETLDYRVFFVGDSGKRCYSLNMQVSPWHDVPLHFGDGVFNFIVEIPKETSAKMEVGTDWLYTPIKQDTKKGKLRYYLYNINWNYGLLPQTWEDTSFANSEVEGALGDNDPVDVVEIGESRGQIGQIIKVKPLAALAMIDEEELDWKIVVISLDDPRASLVSDVDDVEKHFPGTITAIRNWFRDYKIPYRKPAYKFGLGNKPANKKRSLKPVRAFDRLPRVKIEVLMFAFCWSKCNENAFDWLDESWARLVKRSIPAGELLLV